ncbi:MAG TPA: alpha-xylosidase, partial [Rectinemataceae bacterium]|nr:alpha-xylosidase [Rectinemataceae bacterium]
EVLRFFSKLKCRLMPYLFAQAVETVATGLPMMRAMALEFPDDPGVANLDRQYLLGDRLLVAPVFSAEGEAEWYVPEGRWTHFLDGSVVEGPRWFRSTFDYFSLPLFVRPASVLATGPIESRPDYDYADSPTFHVFEAPEGREIGAGIVDAAGEAALGIAVLKSATSIEARLSGPGRGSAWKLHLHGLKGPATSSAGRLIVENSGIVVEAPGGIDHIRVAW